MKLSTFKKYLTELENLHFIQVNGALVPSHFHVTELGLVTKNFVDCGGDVHEEKWANLQIWLADDTDHRLKPAGLLNILKISNQVLKDQDLEIEIEFQAETIGRYALDFKYGDFVLVAKQTDCLAKVQCGIPQQQPLVNLAEAKVCTPGGGCC